MSTSFRISYPVCLANSIPAFDAQFPLLTAITKAIYGITFLALRIVYWTITCYSFWMGSIGSWSFWHFFC
jgi:hypothetical protein